MLQTMKMRKMTVCLMCVRSALARSTGRMRSIAAPVVPMKLASTAPTARKRMLLRGVASGSPVTYTPPEIVNSAASSRMNEMYSCRVPPMLCRPSAPKATAKYTTTGTPKSAATSALLRFFANHSSAVSGRMAIQRSSPTNGPTSHGLRSSPSTTRPLCLPTREMFLTKP